MLRSPTQSPTRRRGRPRTRPQVSEFNLENSVAPNNPPPPAYSSVQRRSGNRSRSAPDTNDAEILMAPRINLRFQPSSQRDQEETGPSNLQRPAATPQIPAPGRAPAPLNRNEPPPNNIDWVSLIRAFRAPQPVLPTFAGLDHENPQSFITECEEHFTHTTTEPSQWTRLAGKNLTEAAAKWFELYKTLNLPWTKFKELLLKKYASTTTLMRLQAQLYSRKQTDKEGTAVFLQQKYMLALRLRPEAQEEEIVAILLESLRPSIRRAIRASAPQAFDELFDRATAAEMDEVEETPKKEPRKEETKPTASKAENNPRETQSRLPPCNYCPERHYHRDCPVFKARIAQAPPKAAAPNPSISENWRSAAVDSTAAQPSTSQAQH